MIIHFILYFLCSFERTYIGCTIKSPQSFSNITSQNIYFNNTYYFKIWYAFSKYCIVCYLFPLNLIIKISCIDCHLFILHINYKNIKCQSLPPPPKKTPVIQVKSVVLDSVCNAFKNVTCDTIL